MIIVSTAHYSVPAGISTIFTIQETGTYGRVLYFKNKTAQTLSIQLQEFTEDGWIDLIDAFNLGAIGSGTEVNVKKVDALTPLRVRASGGGDDDDLEVSYVRLYRQEADTWLSILS
jgi:hypothetical protein